jgi:phospholipase/carboxylesterase
VTHATAIEAPIEIELGQAAQAAVIWLHGLGADGNDFAGIVPELGLPATAAVRFVFPHAPHRPVTLNNGYVMRAWYDLGMGERGFMQNTTHIAESVRAVHALAQREIERGIAPKRIVFAGFSQGGVIALHAGLAWPQPLAGILALSAPLADAAALVQSARLDRATPIFMGHGQYDQIAPPGLGERTADALRADGRNVMWRLYPMEHTVSPAEIDDMGRWLAEALGL